MHISRVAALVWVGLALGCSDESSPPAGDTCANLREAGGDPSFRDDVVPIFEAKCASTSCHASSLRSPSGELKLGTSILDGGTTPGDIAGIYANLIGVASTRSQLKRVEPGDPARSFLLAKVLNDDLEACQAIADTCLPSGCGVRMPRGESPLSTERLATLVDWVNAGAKDN